MIGPAGFNRAAAIGSVRIGASGGARTRAGAAMQGLAGRVANAFDDRYQDVVGYRTEGRSAYAGLRLAVGG